MPVSDFRTPFEFLDILPSFPRCVTPKCIVLNKKIFFEHRPCTWNAFNGARYVPWSRQPGSEALNAKKIQSCLILKSLCSGSLSTAIGNGDRRKQIEIELTDTRISNSRSISNCKKAQENFFALPLLCQ